MDRRITTCIYGLNADGLCAYVEETEKTDDIVFIDPSGKFSGKIRLDKEVEIQSPDFLKQCMNAKILVMQNDGGGYDYLNALGIKNVVRYQPSGKYMNEVRYWAGRFLQEGCLKNNWYKNLFQSIANEKDESFIDGKVIGDFGCGPRGSLAWATRAKQAVGIDVLVDKYFKLFGENMKYHNMWYVNSTENAIPIPSDTFDIISTINSMDHVNNFDKMFSEVMRVLRPNGILLGSFNLNEKATSCEPLTLSYEMMKSTISEYCSIQNIRLAYKGKSGTYSNFYQNDLIKGDIDINKSVIMWVRAEKI